MDNWVKYLIFGYIKQIQNEQSLTNIPLLINYLCILYFYENEYFDKIGDGITVSDDKLTITQTKPFKNNWMNTTYCKNWIESASNKVIKWKFKMNKFSGTWSHNVCIGITSTDQCQNSDFTESKIGTFYGFGDHIKLITNNDADYDYLSIGIFKENDEVLFILNLIEKKIYRQINNDEIHEFCKKY